MQAHACGNFKKIMCTHTHAASKLCNFSIHFVSAANYSGIIIALHTLAAHKLLRANARYIFACAVDQFARVASFTHASLTNSHALFIFARAIDQFARAASFTLSPLINLRRFLLSLLINSRTVTLMLVPWTNSLAFHPLRYTPLSYSLVLISFRSCR